MEKSPVVLIIMDGFGLREGKDGNAIAESETPNLDSYFSDYPFSRLKASGEAVGLPKGYFGSSEVGHLNIGAGRVVKQEEVRIDEMIEDGGFFENEALLNAAKNVKENNSNFHIIGMLSDKGVHSHINHLFALLKFCDQQGITPYIHAITDGRDTLPRVAEKYFEMLDEKIEEFGGDLKTIIGRYYAMDRDERWDRTKLAYDAVNCGEGHQVSSWKEAIKSARENDEGDEFIKPRVIDYDGLKDGDSMVFFNYRSDRPRQLTKALIEKDFDHFDRDVKDVNFVAMVPYYDDIPAPFICEKPHPDMTFGEYISNLGFSQYRIAETEKYAHVTYFFSGEREDPFSGEKRCVIDSPGVATYDQKPEMSAYKTTEKCLEVLNEGETDFIIMNFANCDMVGHTGDFEATVKAVETVDECIGKIVDKVEEKDGLTVITADHGNAETMLTEDGGAVTSHTDTLVPLCIIGEKVELRDGKLGDIVPTLLELIELDIPDEMTGNVLIK